ncbi:MAG: FAD-dependent oxidoreductase [Synergistaceae bacterium]|nr:FAD-dependent oxidoreductase [Synergistaceae bacterium]
MKKFFSFVLAVCFIFTASFAFAFTPGTYEGEGKGYSETAPVKVKVTVDAEKITAVEIDAPEEQPFGVPNFPKYIEALIGRTDGNIDAITSATMSRNGIQEAVNKALEKASSPKEESKTGFTPGTYEGEGKGYSETAPVKVKVTVDAEKITAVEIDAPEEQPFGVPNFPKYIEALIGRADGNIDAITSATMSRNGIQEAVNKALEKAKGGKDAETSDSLSFTPGEYTATADGYNGPVTVKVTFESDKIKGIAVEKHSETAHVGDIAFDIMIPEMIQANGSGVDGVSGATFSTRALRNAVNSAAEQAKCTNFEAFKSTKVEHKPGAPITLHYDVVIVGAGGAGVAAAAQAAQDGNKVIIIEKNAEVGGNTLVSGGQYQSVMPYLVWDPKNPDAATGIYAFTGAEYPKVKSVQGCINELKMILNWSEAPFDADYYKTHEFVAGDALELSKHGVHAEYLPVLKALKAEIKAYLDWAQPKLDAGTPENQLTLFSTLNLHIFQTYYGGLRQSADKSQWIYGDIKLVKQFIEKAQGLKEWLEGMGSTFKEDGQPTLIGALWYRENEFIGANVDTDGDGTPENYPGRWGTYFVAPINAFLKANQENRIMLRTTVKELIKESGRVFGVKAQRYDGTEVTVYAAKGVILATGGYAANIKKVLDENVYWSPEYLSLSTKTTNRSSLQGDGITMAQVAGAKATGLGFTQLMPISWIDNGNLAFGGGNYACWINPNTGKRFVDEGSERDVLSLAEFRNGMDYKGSKGVFLEFYNVEQKMPAPTQLPETGDFAGRYYRRKISELPELFKELGVKADPKVVEETIRNYDKAVMSGKDFPDVGKAIASRPVGNVQKNADGSYNPDTYDLDNTVMTIRLMAPSTHHTMGGLVVDEERHVLTPEGRIIPGLYAAGEVTGGIHGGNRLGGNAITEIFVSGRIAASSLNADNK